MTIEKGKQLVQSFIEQTDKDTDPYLIVHFSREDDRFNGLHERLDKMDAQIIIKQLIEFFDFDELDFEILKTNKKHGIQSLFA